MRIQELFFVPVPAYVEVGQKFISNGLVLESFLAIRHDSFIVDVLDCDLDLFFLHDLVEKRHFQALNRKGSHVRSTALVLFVLALWVELQVLYVLEVHGLAVTVHKGVELFEVRLEEGVIGIVDTIILFLPLLLKIGPNVDCNHKLGLFRLRN